MQKLKAFLKANKYKLAAIVIALGIMFGVVRREWVSEFIWPTVPTSGPVK